LPRTTRFGIHQHRERFARGRTTVERSLFRAKINSDYNDFVARVALEVVDSSQTPRLNDEHRKG
jgi:hypothetical protein